MDIVYSLHAKKRLGQRGITELEVEHILQFPVSLRHSFEGRKIAVGELNGRAIKVVFIFEENYIKIITVA
ncbi:DUF4258 domain-containing protein [Candidatus Woesearchaeota archaeon]|nr:DUF4258 domain-containing protein [Candidatus Woesearchaeota archaeon]